ncbi:MAG: flavin reductase family protein [Gemmatimonadota bacterium]
MTDIDSAQFRQLCGRFATGVVVITATAPTGSPAGMTANSFASVSLVPPLISINVDHAADMYGVLEAGVDFVINILSSEQEAVSRRFASGVGSKFDGIGYRQDERGLIVLDGVIAAIECGRHSQFVAGDHTIYVGRVVGGTVHDGRPLLYYRGGYLTPGGIS